jgi:DNA-directed RNA polymerase alpha subunit
MGNLKDVTDFLNDVSGIRGLDLLTSLAPSNVNKICDELINKKVAELSDKYPNLESPEKEYLASIKNFYGLGQKNKYYYSEIEKGKISLDTSLKKFYDDGDISYRTYNYISKAGDVEYLGELVKYSEKDLLKFRNIGAKCVGEIKKILSKEGYNLGMDINYVRPENRK